MIKVKNNYTSHIGFGTTRVLPGETALLPRGYDENHPMIQFYVGKKWIEIVGDKGAKSAKSGKPAAPPVNITLNTKRIETAGYVQVIDDDGDTGDGETDNEDNDGEEPTDQSGGVANKPVSRMTVDELKALAAELGVEVAETDKRQTLIDKINTIKKDTE